VSPRRQEPPRGRADIALALRFALHSLQRMETVSPLADLSGVSPAVQALLQHPAMRIQVLIAYKAQTKRDQPRLKGLFSVPLPSTRFFTGVF